MPDLIEKTKYCSDSEGKRFDDPEELINNTSIKNIQLLTHQYGGLHHQTFLRKKIAFLKNVMKQSKEAARIVNLIECILKNRCR